MNFDNMNDEQYKKFVNDIAEATVKRMIEQQAEYDAELQKQLEEKYGYTVELKTSTMTYPTTEEELELLKADLELAIADERYEDANEIEKLIKQLKSKGK
jgi:IS5 family transposase